MTMSDAAMIVKSAVRPGAPAGKSQARLRRVAGQLRADRRGTAAAEFALLLPVLTVLLFGTFQYGMIYYTYNVMLNTARNGARALAVGSSTEAQVKIDAAASLPTWVPKESWNIVAKDVGSTLTDKVQTTISVLASQAVKLRFAPMPDTLQATVVMLKQVDD